MCDACKNRINDVFAKLSADDGDILRDYLNHQTSEANEAAEQAQSQASDEETARIEAEERADRLSETIERAKELVNTTDDSLRELRIVLDLA